MDKIFKGKIVSVSGPKTVIVSVTHQFRHPLYKKAVNRMRRFAVHNTKEGVAIGDMIAIKETKPISKTKHFITV